jgi:hypothetical protein
MAEVLDVGCDYVERIPELVRGVTNDDVVEAVRSHIDTERYAAAIRRAA